MNLASLPRARTLRLSLLLGGMALGSAACGSDDGILFSMPKGGVAADDGGAGSAGSEPNGAGAGGAAGKLGTAGAAQGGAAGGKVGAGAGGGGGGSSASSAGTGGSAAGTGGGSGQAGITAGAGGTTGNVAGSGGMAGNTAGAGGTAGNTASAGGMASNTAGAGGTTGNAAGSGGKAGSTAGGGGKAGSTAGSAGKAGAAGSGPSEPPITSPVPLGPAITISALLPAPIVDLSATRTKAIVIEDRTPSRRLRAYPIVAAVPEASVLQIASQGQGDSFHQVVANCSDDRLLLTGGLSPTRLFRDDGTKLSVPNIGKLDIVGFVGEGASALICGTDIDDAGGYDADCCQDGVEVASEVGTFAGGGGGVIRHLGTYTRRWSSLATGHSLDEPVGTWTAGFRGTGYAVGRRCVSKDTLVPDCEIEAGKDTIEWGEIPGSFPIAKPSRLGRFAIDSVASTKLFVTPRYIVAFGIETHLLRIIDRGAREIVLEQANVEHVAVNDTYLLYAEKQALYARPWP